MSVLTIGLIGLGSLTCTGPGDSPGHVEIDSAGIRIITGPLLDHEAPWEIAASRRLAPEDPDSPLHLIQWHGHLTADRRGRLFVMDEVAEQVVVTDEAGSPIGTRGRMGGGPGEYRFPAFLTADSAGGLALVDHAKSAVVRFDSLGGVLPELSYVGKGYAYGGVVVFARAILLHERELDGSGTPVHRLRWIADTGAADLVIMRPPTRGQAHFECQDFTVTFTGSELLLGPELQWTTRADRIAATITDRYEIRLYDGARLSRLIRRPVPGGRAVPGDVDRLFPEGRIVGRAPCRKTAAELIDQLGLSQERPVIGRLQFAPDGKLLVQRFSLPGEQPRLDVLDARGEYLGTLSAGFPVAFLDSGRFIGLVPDEDSGGFQVWLYQLHPAPW